MQAAMSAFGGFEDGPDTVLEGIEAVVGRGRADRDARVLARPARRSSTSPPTRSSTSARRRRGWARSPRRSGSRPGTLRSIHPTHSTCARGRGRRGDRRRPRARATPVRRGHARSRGSVERDALQLFFGCGTGAMTMYHSFECTRVPPFPLDVFADRVFDARCLDGRARELVVRTLVHNPALHPGPDRRQPAAPGASTATPSSTPAASRSSSDTARSSRSACRCCSRSSSACSCERGITIYDRPLPAGAARPSRRRTASMPEPRASGCASSRASRSSACPSMRLDDGAFCHEVQAPGLAPRGSIPPLHADLPARAPARAGGRAGRPRGPRRAAPRSSSTRSTSPEMTVGDLGLLLWADSRAGKRVARQDRLPRPRGASGRGFPDLEGLELSWLGDRRGRGRRRLLLDDALGAPARAQRAAQRRSSATATRGGARGFPTSRRRSTACWRSPSRPAAAASTRSLRRSRAADRLPRLQRPDGGWPWLFDTRSGRVVEPYEIYSVHQDAMAPMALLELTEASGEARYRDAALGGAGVDLRPATSWAARCSTARPGSSTARSAGAAASTGLSSTRTPPAALAGRRAVRGVGAGRSR